MSTGGTTLILSCTLLLKGMKASIGWATPLLLPLEPPLLAPPLPHMCSPIMEISTWLPQSEHLIVGIKTDSLSAPAIFLGSVGSTPIWSLVSVYSDTTNMIIGDMWKRNGVLLS